MEGVQLGLEGEVCSVSRRGWRKCEVHGRSYLLPIKFQWLQLSLSMYVGDFSGITL